MTRPELQKFDYATPYYELTGPSFPEGKPSQGGMLVHYIWREFDEVNGKTLAESIERIRTELPQVLIDYPKVQGIVYQFDVTEVGHTTYVDLFIDLQKKESRQVLYELKSRNLRMKNWETFDELCDSLYWMPEEINTEGIGSLVFLGAATYRRFSMEE